MEILNQLWKDNTYVYTVTTSGLRIFDLITTSGIAYSNNPNFFTTVWANDAKVFLGTSSSGIKYITKASILEGDISDFIENYDYYYMPTNNEIKYIHGQQNTLAVVTASGIDILNNEIQSFKSTTENANIKKCFLTSNNELYYNTQVDSTHAIHRVNTTLCDWSLPDVTYEIGYTFLFPGLSINDFFIGENHLHNNTLFIATSSGVYVYDEFTEDFDTYFIKG